MKINTIVLSLLIVTALSAIHCAFPDDGHPQVFHHAYKFNSTSVLFYGGSELTATRTVLGCSPEPFGAGLVLHPEKVPAHAGFYYEISWSSSNCNYSNAIDAPLGSDGFAAVFLKDLPLDEQVNSSIGTFGVGNMPGAYIIAYSMRYNEFYFCHWNEPISASFVPGELRNRCQVIPHDGHLTCTDWYYFDFIYYNGVLSIMVDDKNAAASVQIGEMDAADYYIGVGFSTDNYYHKQELIEFFYAYSIPPPVVTEVNDSPVPFETPTTPTSEANPSTGFNFEFLGDAQQHGNIFQITVTGGSGLLYHIQPLTGVTAFMSRFTWTPTDCDPVYNGADGWSFFLTKNIPTLEQVESSAGGSLGIQNVPNTIMAAYSATFNEFWISNWTDPIVGNFRWQVAYEPVSGPKYTCGGSYNFIIVYDQPVLQIILDKKVVVAAEVDLDPSVPYYYGLSGGTGEGYFRQYFTNWSIAPLSPLV